MKELAILLGMAENSTTVQLCEAVNKIKLQAANADALQKVVEEKLSEGLSEENKKFFLGLCKTSMPSALEFLALSKLTAETIKPEAETTAAPETTVVKKETTIASLIQLNKKDATPAADGKDSYDYLQKKNSVELARIKSEEPEKFKELQAGYAAGVRYEGK